MNSQVSARKNTSGVNLINFKCKSDGGMFFLEQETPRSVENNKGKTQHKAESRSRDTLEESCKTLVRSISTSAGLSYITITRHKQAGRYSSGGHSRIVCTLEALYWAELCFSQEFVLYFYISNN